jgi:uncharacterized protein YyaL (SSP411 family)
VAAAGFLAERHLVGGRLRRVSRAGVVGEPVGVLDDYGCVAEAFCAVHQLTGDGRWLELAGGLLDVARAHFSAKTSAPKTSPKTNAATDSADDSADPNGDGYFDTADDAEQLVARPADPTDNATPSGLSSLAAALVAYSALTGEVAYREAAERALETVSPIVARHPRYAGYAAAVAEALIAGPYEIAIVGPQSTDLVAAARRYAPPGSVIVVGEPDQPGVPLLEGRPAIGGAATAYVCRGFVCDRPVTTAAALVALLGGPSSLRNPVG